jgi:hypothetical protein
MMWNARKKIRMFFFATPRCATRCEITPDESAPLEGAQNAKISLLHYERRAIICPPMKVNAAVARRDFFYRPLAAR